VRKDLAAARRVVVKVGSSSLTAAEGGIDQAQVRALAGQITALRRRGVTVVLVSSGAIAAGLGPLGLARRPRDVAEQQAAAGVGQVVLMNDYQRAFARRKVTVGQVLLTQEDFVRRTGYVNAHAALEQMLSMGVLPIVNENDAVAVHEIRFGDNDRLAALVAMMVRADLLILLSDVDGVYTEHPKKRTAQLLDRVEDLRHLDGLRLGRRGSSLGSGGMSSKVEAVKVASASGAAVVIANARAERVLERIVRGDEVGTAFAPHRVRGRSRKLWIEFARTSTGTITVDAGARAALAEGGRSLLPVGVTGHTGSFAVGDAVEVAGPDGTVFAKGITNYAADEIDAIKGARMADDAREIIHRDSLVLL
jgi:glutamate 5-kinase